MAKYLVVGDVHAVASELDECQKLADYIFSIVEKEKCNLILLGDLFNNFRAIDMAVLHFWDQFFNKVNDILEFDKECLVLVGNHDMPGNGLFEFHSLSPFKWRSDKITIVDGPCTRDGALFLPYIHDQEEFIKKCKDWSGENTLICHQTFLGVKYDNGFYSKDGIDPDLVPQKYIISGHIHTPSAFGKVLYPGAPRSRTLSDANVERSLLLLEISEDGEVVELEKCPTKSVCKQIMHFKDTLENQPTIQDDGNEYRIDIYGSESYIEERKLYYRTLKNIKLRSFPTQSFNPIVKESDGLEQAFLKFYKNYKPQFGSSTEDLVKLVKERIKIDVSQSPR